MYSINKVYLNKYLDSLDLIYSMIHTLQEYQSFSHNHFYEISTKEKKKELSL